MNLSVCVVGDGESQRLTLPFRHLDSYKSAILYRLIKSSHEQGCVAAGVNSELRRDVSLQTKNHSFDYGVYIHVSHLASPRTSTFIP